MTPDHQLTALRVAIAAIRDEIQNAASDLIADAATWRETSTATGGYAATALMQDALENEARAAELEAWCDDLSAVLAASQVPQKDKNNPTQEDYKK